MGARPGGARRVTMAGLSIDAEALDDIGWNAVLDALARRCATERGEALAKARGFAAGPDEARVRIEEISEARRLLAVNAPLSFAGVTDVERAAGRAEKGAVLAPEELVAVADAARGIARLGRHLSRCGDEAPRLAERAPALPDLGHVYGPIHDAFEPGPRLADHASDALGGLRRRVAALTAELEARARNLLGDPDLSPHLQDRFTTQREDRYVVPVKAGAQASVKGIVHGTSQSGQTVFIEPEAIVDLNNRVVIAECDVAEEERRILAELSAYVGEEAQAVCAGVDAATELDVVSAAARLAEDLDASPPAIAPGAALSLKGARNPQMVIASRACVANDIEVRDRSLLLISGPNAGGKTVALKTAGLAIAMAHAGLHIAADPGSSLPWLSAVHTHLGDAQNLDRDLSTFSAQVVAFGQFLARGDASTFLLLDEVAVGTDPEQGAALAQAVLEALADRGVSGIVTTHYERLKALATADDRFANASVGFDIDSMQPTFKLHLGLPGSSGAFAVARRIGLPEAVVARGEALLGEAGAGVEQLLGDIARERDAARAERSAAEDERASAERARAQVEAEAKRLREERRRVEEAEDAAAVAALRRAREEIDRVRAEVRKADRQADIAAAEGRLDRAARRLAVQAKARQQSSAGDGASTAPNPDVLEAGTEVYVSGLGGRGRVVERPKGQRVTVQLGALRTQVAVGDLRLDPGGHSASGGGARPLGGDGGAARTAGGGAAKTAAESAARSEGGQSPAIRTPDSTLDVRGHRVHEALAELDRFIDRSLLAHIDAVFVLHGHGTGALRRAVREHAAAHPAASAWSAASPEDGGDGVTVISLDVGE